MNSPGFSGEARSTSFERKVIIGALIAIAATYLILFASAILYDACVEPEYRAVARFQLLRFRLGTSGLNAGVNSSNPPVDAQDFDIKITEMSSSTIIRRVIHRLTPAERCEALTPYWEGNIFTGPLSEEEVLGNCRRIVPDCVSFTAAVEFNHPNKALAHRIAGYFVEEIQRSHDESVAEAINPQIERIKIHIDQLLMEIKVLQKQMAFTPDAAAIEIEKAIRGKEAAYDQILATYILKAKQTALVSPAIRLLDAPSVSDRPVNKNLPLVLVIATGAATAISALITLVAGIALFLRRAANPPTGNGRP